MNNLRNELPKHIKYFFNNISKYLDKDNIDLYLYFDRKEYDFLSKLDKESLEYKKFIDLID